MLPPCMVDKLMHAMRIHLGTCTHTFDLVSICKGDVHADASKHADDALYCVIWILSLPILYVPLRTHAPMCLWR